MEMDWPMTARSPPRILFFNTPQRSLRLERSTFVPGRSSSCTQEMYCVANGRNFEGPWYRKTGARCRSIRSNCWEIWGLLLTTDVQANR